MRQTVRFLAGSVLAVVIAAGTILFAADEIKVTCKLVVNKDQLDVDVSPARIQVDMVGESISDIVQAFAVDTTNEITIAAGVVTNGYTFFYNLTTNTAYSIDIGNVESNTFWPVLQLKAAEYGLIRIHPTSTIYGKASGGTVYLRSIVIED